MKFLWIGDACCSTGFAKCTHKTIPGLLEAGHEVVVLGINSFGTPHRHLPYDVWPCFPGGDLFGLGRMKDMIYRFSPDAIIIQNDPWNFPRYLERSASIPVIGAVAVDGKNCRGRDLNGLACAIFWTEFGEREAKLGGYAGPSAVVGLGVDLGVYRPMDRREARLRMGLPPKLRDAFIVGQVNRNHPRKRLDLTIAYFCEWVRSKQVMDAYLYLHVGPTGDIGYDVKQLMAYYGLSNRLVLAEPEVVNGESEETVATTLNCFDVGFTTTQGEGWGLPIIEGMACGVPQVVPDWAALGEWTASAAIKVRCSSIACTPNGINAVGGIMDAQDAVDTLDDLYRSKRGQAWARYRQRGLDLVARPEFRWENVATTFAAVVERALTQKRPFAAPAPSMRIVPAIQCDCDDAAAHAHALAEPEAAV